MREVPLGAREKSAQVQLADEEQALVLRIRHERDVLSDMQEPPRVRRVDVRRCAVGSEWKGAAGHRVAEHSVHAWRIEPLGRKLIAEATPTEHFGARAVQADEEAAGGRQGFINAKLQLGRPVHSNPRYFELFFIHERLRRIHPFSFRYRRSSDRGNWIGKLPAHGTSPDGIEGVSEALR